MLPNSKSTMSVFMRVRDEVAGPVTRSSTFHRMDIFKFAQPSSANCKLIEVKPIIQFVD
jgi:hypothetical protein